ncbi:beta strand repeat-containing protein, partial [Aequorivita flava]
MKNILLLLLFSFSICTNIQAQTITWTGAIDANYSNVNNWNPAQVPTAVNDVIIPTASNVDVNIDASVKSITIQGTAVVNLFSNLTFTSPSSSDTGSVVNWISSSISGGSTFTNNGTFNLTTTSNKSIVGSTTINNEGNFNITTSGDLYITDGIFNNQLSGVIDLQEANGNITYSGGGSHTLNNYGRIKRTTNTGTVYIQTVLNNNNGVIDVEIGDLILNSLVQNLTDGTYNVNAGSVLQWGSNATLAGTLSGVLDGEIDWINTVTVASATTATFNFTGNSGVSWSNGDLTGGGTLINKSIIFLPGTSNKSIFGLTNLNNEGDFNITGSGDLYITDGVFNNQISGVIDMQANDGNFTYSGAGSRILNNSGLIKRTATTGNARINNILNNNGGTIRVETGNLILDGLENYLNSGTYNIFNGAILQWASNTYLTGTLTGNLDGEISWISNVLVANPNSATFDFTGPNGVNWYSGTLNGGGTLINKSLVFLTSTNNRIITGLTILNNEGVLEIKDSGDLYISDGIFNNQNSGVIDLQAAAGNITYSGGASRVLNNAGLIKRTTTLGDVKIGTILNNNNGTISVETGNLILESLDNNLTDGTYNVASGSVFQWASNTILTGTLSGVLNGEIAWTSSVTVPASISATFNFTGSSGVHWSNGILTGGGTLINKSLIFQQTTSNKQIVGLTNLNNEGLFNIMGSGDLYISDGVFNNQTSGILDLQTAGGNIYYSGAASRVLNNFGLIKRTTTPGDAKIGVLLNNNDGTLTVETGNLILESLDNNLTDGTYNVAAGSILQWASNTNIAGTLTGLLNGDISWINTVTIPVSTTAIFNFSGTNAVNWSSGNLTGGGTLINKSVISRSTTSNTSILGLTTINNEANFNMTSSGDLYISDGIFNNQTTGVLDFQVDAGNFTYSGGGSTVLNNYGLMKKSGGTGSTYIYTDTKNFGSIDVQSGTFDFADSDPFSNKVAGVIKGVGTINISNTPNYTNEGIYAPGASPGKLTFVGTYISDATSVLDIEINGLTQVTEYDLLEIVGTNAVFNGSVNLSLGFDASVGDSFTIATVSGTIATKNLQSPIYADFGCKQLTFNITYPGDNAVVLTVTEKKDVIPPVVITQDISVQLDASGNVSITPSQIDNGSTDNCTLPANLIFSLDQTSFTCANLGSNTVTLTVTDEAGNSASATAIVTVEDNLQPILQVQNITVQLDSNGDATITANDIDNGTTDNCTITSLSIDIDTFNCSNIGANTVNFSAEDQSGNISTISVTVTVEDNIAPTAVCQNITVQLDATGNATIAAADVDGGSSDACGIATMSVSPSTFTCADIGPNTVTLTVIDVNGNSNTCTAVVTVEDNIAPTAVCQNITVQLDATGNATIAAADVDGGSSDACGIASMSVSPSTFTCADIGPNTVTLTVTDINGNVSTCTAVVTVEDNVSPTAVCQNITVQLDATGNATIAAADVDGGSSDACGIASMSVSPSVFTCADVGPNTVTLTVTDINGNSNTCTAVVTVEDNIAPTAVCQNITVQLDNTGNATIAAADVDGGSSDACGIASMSVSPSTFTCANIGPNTVTLTVTDVNGDVSTCTTTVTVADNVAPVATCAAPFTLPLDATGNASITVGDIDAGSTDACGIASATIDKSTFTCADVGSNTVTLTV